MRQLTLALLMALAVIGCGKKNPDPEPTPKPTPGPTPNGTDPKPGPSAETDEQKVQGVWKVVGVEREDGPPLTPAELRGLRMAVKDNMVTVSYGAKQRFDEYFTFKADPTASPKSVDFTDCDEKGVPLDERFSANNRGIYKFEGDELVIALAVEGSKAGYRPTEFKAMLKIGRREKSGAVVEPTKQVVVIRLKKADAGETITPNPRPKGGPSPKGEPSPKGKLKE